MARLSTLVNNCISNYSSETLSESLETLIEMVKEDMLSEEELAALSETLDVIVEELDEMECEGCGNMFPSTELDPETGLCEACKGDKDLVESVKRRKKKNCPPGKKRVDGKCVKKTMAEIKAQKKLYKVNRKQRLKAAAKWRKTNKSYISQKYGK